MCVPVGLSCVIAFFCAVNSKSSASIGLRECARLAMAQCFAASRRAPLTVGRIVRRDLDRPDGFAGDSGLDAIAGPTTALWCHGRPPTVRPDGASSPNRCQRRSVPTLR